MPDRGDDCQYIGRGHLGHGPRPDARERIGAQTARPVLRVLGIPPAGALLLQHHGGGLAGSIGVAWKQLQEHASIFALD